MNNTYYTAAARAVWEEKIRQSVFIGHAAPVSSEDEAREFIAQIRREHAGATHNCYAYHLGTGSQSFSHCHDHGEPPGTAGRPILNAIRKTGLTDTVVVVTRYYGGKKLGIRGLIDAYHSVALGVLEKAGKKPIVPSFTLNITCAYPQLSAVNQILHKYQGITEKADYQTRVSLHLRIPEKNRKEFLQALSALPDVTWENSTPS